jgi:acetyl esterase/lipase
VIIAPGGSYLVESVDIGGIETARWLNGLGVTACILRYRLPAEGWARRSDVPLQDAQRAVRVLRANADRLAIDIARIGMIGFSAGGHLAASLATRADAHAYDAVDVIDQIDACPNFVVLFYPVVTMGEGTHETSRDNLLGPDPTPDLIDAYSCDRHVVRGMPPVFICFAADDASVPPMPNGVAFYRALRAEGNSCEMHAFEEGGHGFGIADTVGKSAEPWPDLLARWCRRHEFFKT